MGKDWQHWGVDAIGDPKTVSRQDSRPSQIESNLVSSQCMNLGRAVEHSPRRSGVGADEEAGMHDV